MTNKELFFKEKNENTIPLTHITDASINPSLAEVDELYGAADVLSIYNAGKHRKILLALSVVGTLLTLAFLLYDVAELHGLILACGVMVLFLVLIRRAANRLECHRKYLEYRVLAECLRCQFFLFFAGINTKVADIMPWSIKKGIPWITEVLQNIKSEAAKEKQSILEPWVKAQKEYHKTALEKTKIKYGRDNRIAKAVLIITIAAYIAALIYELLIFKNAITIENVNLIRAILKIVLGTMSAATLFTGNYYGKMSLSNVIDDHKRMIALYELAEEEILKDGESEELLLLLAREFLNENSTWYAYQCKNKPEIAI